MIEESFAKKFAEEWIEAWNSHDISAIMDHYANDIVFLPPFIVQVNNDPTETINGKDELERYFRRALDLYPDLRFGLLNVLSSVNSIVLYYTSVKELTAAEFMELDENGKVLKVCAHYSK